MNNQINANDIKESVSLVDLLARLGYQPHRRSGQEHIYFSMLRDSDINPSFCVNDKLGCWYDHGMGKGGSIIDFGLLYWRNLTFGEVLEKIVALSDTDLPLQTSSTEYRRKRMPVKIPHYQIQGIKELGNNPAITAYLESRGIWHTARGTLKELYYYVEDREKHRKHFFAAGWQNELGAWEVRNINFKGCLGHKAISFIPGDSNRLSVFEGFVDYLSWLSDNPFSKDSILVLNSCALLQQGILRAKDFSQVSTYFDHDPTGRQVTLTFQAAIPQAIDRSSVYEGYNDYNDKLVAEMNQYQIQR